MSAVWLYEGLWCKLLGGEPHQLRVVEAVPRFDPRVRAAFPEASRDGRGGAGPLGSQRCRTDPGRGRSDAPARGAERWRSVLGAADHSRSGRYGGKEFRLPRTGLGLGRPSAVELRTAAAATAWERGRFDDRCGPSKLLFGRMHEDASIELAAFRPGGRIFCIASAGCTAMELSRRHEVVAADINPVQIAYARRTVLGRVRLSRSRGADDGLRARLCAPVGLVVVTSA